MKYILIGGYPWKAPDGGRALCEEMVKYMSKPINILVCMFARPKKDWTEKFEEDKEFFSGHLPNKKIKFILASETGFLQQLEKADILYIRGGDTLILKNKLSSIGDWPKVFKGKVILGSSAGTNILTRYYNGLDHPGIHEGFGILPIKAIVHYGSDYIPGFDWQKAKEKMKNYKEELELITLAEGEFKVIEQ